VSAAANDREGGFTTLVGEITTCELQTRPPSADDTSGVAACFLLQAERSSSTGFSNAIGYA